MADRLLTKLITCDMENELGFVPEYQLPVNNEFSYLDIYLSHYGITKEEEAALDLELIERYARVSAGKLNRYD
jgi:hypothetical protein